MNNNRNNRRRGRGNNRSQGGGQINRIDSRARGNAPQLLEKYRKMAHDAALNGDRVQAEYYLQFADHYFRVIADSRSQREDIRPRRDDQRDMEQDGNFLDNEDDDGEQSYRRPEPRRDESEDDRFGSSETEEDTVEADGTNPYEPPENPFTRGNRGRGNDQDRSDRGEKRAPRRSRGGNSEEPRGEEIEPKGIDATVLPPAIGAAPALDADDETDGGQKPAPRRRGRKPRSEAGGEPLEKVG